MKMQKYDRHSTVDIQTVIELIKEKMKLPASRQRERVEFNGIPVRLGSLRLQTFATSGTTCTCCGLKAGFFAIERDMGKVARGEKHYHLNLWGVDEHGDEMLFTHDHTLARGLGGADDLSNTTTMCVKCNYIKSLDEASLAAARGQACED